MKRYLAYIRVSTVKQGEHGSSLQEQRSSIEIYAAKHGLEICAWYEEMETAAKLGRQMFNRMLGEIEKGNAAGIIIHKIDRSARNLKDWARLGELIDLGVEVHFAHESLDLASRGGRLAADIQAVVAADYIRNLRQEVRKGFYGRLKQGFYPLPAPRGYLNQGKAKPKTIDPIEGPLVRDMLELYASGQYSFDSLRREMKSRGLSGSNGKLLARNAVARILHNPFYMGVLRLERTGETFQGNHTPLIPAATFQRIQEVMSGRAYARPGRHEPLFRRLITCSGCGYRLTGERQKAHIYYRCHSRSCRGTSIRESYFIRVIEAYIKELYLPDQDIGDLRDLVQADAANVEAEASARRQEQTLKLNLCENRLSKLTDAFLDGAIDKDLFEKRKSELYMERQALRDQLEEVSVGSVRQRILKKIELVMAKAKVDFDAMEDVRDLLALTTSNLSVVGKELVIEPNFPFGHIIKWQKIKNGEPYRILVRNNPYLLLRELEDGLIWNIDLHGAAKSTCSCRPDHFLDTIPQTAEE